MSTIHLTLDLPLSDADRSMLTALASVGLGDLPPAPVTKAKATKPKPKAKPKPEPAPEPESPADPAEAPAEPEAKTGPSVDDAVARAAALLSEGKADEVKAALATLDISRVSQLKPSQVEAFLKELEA